MSVLIWIWLFIAFFLAILLIVLWSQEKKKKDCTGGSGGDGDGDGDGGDGGDSGDGGDGGASNSCSCSDLSTCRSTLQTTQDQLDTCQEQAQNCLNTFSLVIPPNDAGNVTVPGITGERTYQTPVKVGPVTTCGLPSCGSEDNVQTYPPSDGTLVGWAITNQLPKDYTISGSYIALFLQRYQLFGPVAGGVDIDYTNAQAGISVPLPPNIEIDLTITGNGTTYTTQTTLPRNGGQVGSATVPWGLLVTVDQQGVPFLVQVNRTLTVPLIS